MNVLEHLRMQLASARRLLGIMLAQTEAIGRQDVESVLARLTDLQGELGERRRLELERDELLAEVARTLGRDANDLELDDLLTLCTPIEVAPVRAASAELRGLLLEVARVHDQNRVLIRQELSFLDHLMRLMSGSPQAGYRPGGWTSAPQTMSVLDAKA
jgi:flagellar FlgN protein